MNVIEYYPHLKRGLALACLGRRDEASAELAKVVEQGAAPAVEIAALRAALPGAVPSAGGRVAILHDGTAESHEKLLQAFKSMCAAPTTTHAVGTADVVAKIRAESPGVLVALGPRSALLAREQLSQLRLITAAPSCGAPGGGQGPTVGAVSFVDVLAIVRRLRPDLKTVALLHSPTCAGRVPAITGEARGAGVELFAASAATAKDYPPAMKGLLSHGPDALVLWGLEGVDADVMRYVVSACLEKSVPVVGDDATQVRQGALAAVVPAPAAVGRRAAEVATGILAGKSPADPAPVAVAAALNLIVAKNLGIQVPADLVEAAVLVLRP